MIKFIAEKSTFLYRDSTGREHYRGAVVADTCAELAGVTVIGNVELEFGSVALCADGELCMLDSEGTWHKKDGTAVTADE